MAYTPVSFHYIDYDYLKNTTYNSAYTTVGDFDEWDDTTPALNQVILYASIRINNLVSKENIKGIIEEKIAEGDYETYFTTTEKNSIQLATAQLVYYYLKNGYDDSKGSGSFSEGGISGSINNPSSPNYIPENVQTILYLANLYVYRQGIVDSHTIANKVISRQAFGVNPQSNILVNYLTIDEAYKNFVNVTPSGAGGQPVNNIKTDTPGTVSILQELDPANSKPVVKVNVHSEGTTHVGSGTPDQITIPPDTGSGYTISANMATAGHTAGLISYADADTNFRVSVLNAANPNFGLPTGSNAFYYEKSQFGIPDIFNFIFADGTTPGILTTTHADIAFRNNVNITNPSLTAIDFTPGSAGTADAWAINFASGNSTPGGIVTQEYGDSSYRLNATIDGSTFSPTNPINVVGGTLNTKDAINFRLYDGSTVNDENSLLTKGQGDILYHNLFIIAHALIGNDGTYPTSASQLFTLIPQVGSSDILQFRYLSSGVSTWEYDSGTDHNTGFLTSPWARQMITTNHLGSSLIVDNENPFDRDWGRMVYRLETSLTYINDYECIVEGMYAHFSGGNQNTWLTLYNNAIHNNLAVKLKVYVNRLRLNLVVGGGGATPYEGTNYDALEISKYYRPFAGIPLKSGYREFYENIYTSPNNFVFNNIVSMPELLSSTQQDTEPNIRSARLQLFFDHANSRVLLQMPSTSSDPDKFVFIPNATHTSWIQFEIEILNITPKHGF